MSDNSNTYLAMFLGSRTSPAWQAWEAMSESERHAKGQQGMAAWHAWVEKYRDAVVAMGGPLGKTKRVDKGGVNFATSMHIAFDTDEMRFRITYRVDGRPMWHSAITPFKGTNTRSPFIVLANR